LKVTLKKVTPKPTVSQTLPTLCNNSEEYHQLMEESYMENYFEMIKSFSFQSVFHSLEKEIAEALLDGHKKFCSGKISKSIIEENEALQRLVKLIDRLHHEAKWPHIFVRLSSRSPKDAALSAPIFQEIYHRELKKLAEEEKDISESSDANRKLQALYRASTYALRQKSGFEAVCIMIESDRIQGDLKEFVEGQVKSDFNLVIREFRTFAPEMEFRGFVYNKRLTALTQYNEFCYFPFLKSHSQAIVNKIEKDFEAMIKVIPLKNYIVDFVLAPDSDSSSSSTTELEQDPNLRNLEKLKVFIVELNPFAEFAGAGLFDWVTDKALLMGLVKEKESKVEFKYRESLPNLKWVLGSMTPNWRLFIAPPTSSSSSSSSTSSSSSSSSSSLSSSVSSESSVSSDSSLSSS